MAYMHIDNLYKNKEILMFKKCYELEKIHGISAHITYRHPNQLHCHNDLFNKSKLLKLFKKHFNSKVIIYGEIYGDKIQKMRNTYGDKKQFIAFDVQIDGMWLNTLNAHDVCNKLDIEFVAYNLINTSLKDINAARDKESIQAIRNNMGKGKIREGIILRPLIELTKNNGNRIICKHKNDKFRETKTPRIITDAKLKTLKNAEDIAEEWVTPERLNHILTKLNTENNISSMPKIISAMIEDVYREGKDELIESGETKKAIARKTNFIFKNYIKKTRED